MVMVLERHVVKGGLEVDVRRQREMGIRDGFGTGRFASVVDGVL